MSITSNNIKQLRQKNHWKQADMARKLNISIPAYSKIESGVSDINMSRLAQFAEVFHVSTIDLLSADHFYAIQLEKINMLKIELEEKTARVSKLQAKIIELYEEKEGLHF